MPWSESLPQFSLAGTLLTVLLLFFAAFGEPLLGRRAFSWLSRRRDGDERALGLLYAVTVAIHVLWGLMVLVVLLISPALNLVDLGLRTPDAFGPIVGAAVGGLIALAAFWVLVNGLPTKERFPVLGKLSGGKGGKGKSGRRAKPGDADAESTEDRGKKGHRGHRGRRGAAKPMTLPEPGRQQYLLLPRTGRERGLAAGMAVTGGVFGELLYRGLFITLVASMGVPLWVAAVLSIVVFAVAHAYQGWWGLLSAGFSGTLFTILYLGTGSLVIPILVHVALNLRSVVFPPAADREAAQEAYRSGDHYDDEYDEYDEYEGQGHSDQGYRDTEYGEDDYGRTGEFEAVEGNRTESEPATAAAPAGPPAPPLQQGPPPAGTPPFGQSAPYPGPHNPGPRPPQPGPGHFQQGPPPPYQPTPPQPPQHRPPQGLPQGPPPGYGQQPSQFPQGPPPAYPHPSAPPASDGGDFLSGPGSAADQSGHRLYPDEWIDRHHGPEGDTPGPGSPHRD
ncbi:CPBP family intramembrane glutamic endopeptidase [Nocardiopsis valliformis]|uniref:CPBP family intramembrane glutamic endopeptidase n=1 Tax=Nocardiopsis valliformis TaxID=239974 RepID=UPI0003451303|nr:CPBP family intramembrane glutamic endopeptidase [Nocardiopsis valliformis]